MDLNILPDNNVKKDISIKILTGLHIFIVSEFEWLKKHPAAFIQN